MVRIIGKKEIHTLSEKEKEILLDVSHESDIWTKRLSPRFLGPVSLYGAYKARTVHNGYQHTKVFKHHTGALGLPTDEYLKWATKWWKMLKVDESILEKEPEYYYWYGIKHNKIEARKYIFVPLYIQAVTKEGNFLERLKRFYYKNDKTIILYDVYGCDNITYDEAVENDAPFSHAFVLKMLLETSI